MSAGTPRADRRVYFHVGAPKTGTTYLQQRLFKNRASLADDGVLYPYALFADSFRSTLDFCGSGWGGNPATRYRGEWDTVATRIREWTGPTAIVSNELFGHATRERIESGLRTLGEAEVHVVFTARDIARQLVSDWQEHIKHKHVVTLETFVSDLVALGIEAPQPFGEMFWGLHDPLRVLDQWGQFVPAERIHLVTVPQPGGPTDTLWQRFTLVTGLDPLRYADMGARTNSSMGVSETELVRRMNRRLRRMPSDAYDPLVRRLLAEKILGSKSHRLTLPPEQVDWATAWSDKAVAELHARGYDVVGDLSELMPREADHTDHVSPTALTDADLAPAAIRGLTRVLLYAARQRRTITSLRGQLTLSEAPEPTQVAVVRPQAPAKRVRGRARSMLRSLRR